MLERAQRATPSWRLETRLQSEHVAHAENETTMHGDACVDVTHGDVDGIEDGRNLVPLGTRALLDGESDRSVQQQCEQE